MLFRYRSRNTETQSRSSDVAYRICGIAAPWHYGPVALRPVPVAADALTTRPMKRFKAVNLKSLWQPEESVWVWLEEGRDHTDPDVV